MHVKDSPVSLFVIFVTHTWSEMQSFQVLESRVSFSLSGSRVKGQQQDSSSDLSQIRFYKLIDMASLLQYWSLLEIPFENLYTAVNRVRDLYLFFLQ